MKINSTYDLAVQFCKILTENAKSEPPKAIANLNKTNYIKKKAAFTEFGDTFIKEQKAKK